MAGPFDILPVEVLRVPMRDGVEIELAQWRPSVPDGVRVPVVLHAEPYADACSAFRTPPATCSGSLDRDGQLDRYHETPRLLVQAGYAYASMSVRGTGDSGGCFDGNGPNEAEDIGEVIDYLGESLWSNGHVAMFGLSYMGTTPWLGALQHRDALKAIVAAGIVTHEYTFGYTPQGAGTADTVAFNVPYFAGLTLMPPVLTDDPGAPAEWAQLAPDRLCPEILHALTAYPAGAASDDRNEAFFEDRNSISRLGEVTTPALVMQGLWEGHPGHGFEEDIISEMLTQANLTMVLGQWGHTIPIGDRLDEHPHSTSWPDLLMPFLAHHLKGAPAPAWAGAVTYQESDRTWRTSLSWPPEKAKGEVLYATPDGLSPTSRDGAFTLTGTRPQTDPICSVTSVGNTPTPAAFITTSEALADRVTIAGNPMVYASVESDVPSGLVAVDLYDLAPDATCENGEAVGMVWLSGGAADLRFHDSPYQGHDFPTGPPAPVRIDLMNLAHTLEPGHRIGVVWSTWGKTGYETTRPAASLTLHAGSEGTHIVLPVVDGTLHGNEPTMDYPPRPFTSD